MCEEFHHVGQGFLITMVGELWVCSDQVCVRDISSVGEGRSLVLLVHIAGLKGIFSSKVNGHGRN